MTTTAPVTDLQDASPAARMLVDWLETTHLPEGLFTEDVFLDLSSPRWRQQAQGIDDVLAIRDHDHPAPGSVPRVRYDPTPTGFVLEWEEEWDDANGHWYCREMARADLREDRICRLSVYCTGDWSASLVARHAREEHLIRP